MSTGQAGSLDANFAQAHVRCNPRYRQVALAWFVTRVLKKPTPDAAPIHTTEAPSAHSLDRTDGQCSGYRNDYSL